MKLADMRLAHSWSAAGAIALLAACGGSGSGPISAPNPPPVPSPSPTPTTPTPTSPQPPPQGAVPSQFNTAEFQNSDGPDFHNAEAAWQLGFTGKGVTLAVIDDGMDLDTGEFAGRLHPDSQDVLQNRSVEGDGYHGTHVALVAAAGRNNSRIMGIAYDATLLALRGEVPGNCTVGNPLLDAGCGIASASIAAGIDQAIASGARVVNLSVSDTVPAASEVLAAVRRAVAAGVIIVVSAGNQGAGNGGIDGDNPLIFAQSFADAGPGGVIIAGSVNSQGRISSFSNRAGSYSDSYITALGENICCIYYDGELFTGRTGSPEYIGGTSFSAPQVAGAVALLAQAFPHLSGKEIVEILIESAFDAGDPGPDRTYGAGILDIAAAFAPRGTTKLPGAVSAMPLSDTTAVSSISMGDALAGQSLQAVVLDKYSRAYVVDLAANMRGAELPNQLHGALRAQTRSVGFGDTDTSIAFTFDATDETRQPWTGELRLTEEEARAARVLAGRVVQRLAPDLQIGFAFAETARGVVAQMQGQDRPAFLVAQDAAAHDGMFRITDLAFALRRKTGPWGLAFSAESGQVLSGAPWASAESAVRRDQSGKVRSFGIAGDRVWGPIDVSLGLTWVSEAKTILGAQFHDGMGVSGAETLFLDIHAGWSFAPRWRLGGAIRNGLTQADAGQFITGNSRMSSQSWSLDIERAGVFGKFDRLGFRVAQPLRVESGGLALNLPVAFDYFTLEPVYALHRLSLAPKGREVMGEIAWRGPFFGGFAQASAFYRRQPGHYANSPDDTGIVVRWSRDF